MKGQTFMPHPTRTTSTTDGLLRRRVLESAQQRLTAAAVDLELLLSDVLTLPAPAWADMSTEEQVLRAAEAVIGLDGEDAPTANWRVEMSANIERAVSLEGSVHDFQHPAGFDPRAAMARWGRILGGTTEEKPSGARVQIDVRGEYRGIPVRMWTLTATATRPAAVDAPTGGTE